MINYDDYLITFTEVPDEISLCFNITGCPCHCRGCFEPWLQDNFGAELTTDVIEPLIQKYYSTTCICFMGGDIDHKRIMELIEQCRKKWPQLKFAMYSGFSWFDDELASHLDYYKVGPYKEIYGPLNKPTTNQHFYKKENNKWIDITYRFYDKTV